MGTLRRPLLLRKPSKSTSSSLTVTRFNLACRVTAIVLSSLLGVPYARALEGCSVLPLVEVSAALDPTSALTVQGGDSKSPQVGICQFQTGDGSILLVNAADDQTLCAKTLSNIEQQKPGGTILSGIGDRALLRSQDDTMQLITNQASQCIALTMKRQSNAAELDTQHVLTVLAGEALSRSWTGQPKPYWDEPADLAHPLTDERIRSYERLLKQNPQYLEVLTALANLHLRLNQYESARPYVLRAIDIVPKRADLYYDLGTIDWEPVKRFLGTRPMPQDGVSQTAPACVPPEESVLKCAEKAIQDMNTAMVIDPEYSGAATFLYTMYSGRADLHCQDAAAREADLKKAEEWHSKGMEGMQRNTPPASRYPATVVMWQGVTPAGMPPPPSVGAASENSSKSQEVRVTQGVSEGLLITQVQPVYPPLARQARVQGTVVLNALIGKDGAIEQLEVASGHPMLAPAALEAVKQWKYKPYFLNGFPVEVQTTINVNFALTDK